MQISASWFPATNQACDTTEGHTPQRVVNKHAELLAVTMRLSTSCFSATNQAYNTTEMHEERCGRSEADRPADARLDGLEDSLVGRQHGLVHCGLVLTEPAAGWEGAGDVAVIAVVLAPHV